MKTKKQPKAGGGPGAKPVKAGEARAAEAALILRQLQDLGFPDEDLRLPREALAAFADRGEGMTDVYKYRHHGVEVRLQLSTQPHVVSFARVRRIM
jgi:hypothetical protein